MRALLVLAVGCFAACTSRSSADGSGDTSGVPDSSVADGGHWLAREVMIPMRDGVRLHAWLVRDLDVDGSLPVELVRNPYQMKREYFEPDASALGAPGMLTVFVSERGRFDSEGTFGLLDARPAASEDTYDLIEWLTKSEPRVAPRVVTAGTSYPAWASLMGARTPHPAHVGLLEQACVGDAWIGDDLFHHGAFRIAYAVEWLWYLEGKRDEDSLVAFERRDLYDWYLALGTAAAVNERYFDGGSPMWNSVLEHPAHDSFWKERALPPHVERSTVPALHVAGLFDQEDPWGPVKSYEAMEKFDDSHRNFLLLGPWYHGGWWDTGESLGALQFGSKTSEEFKAARRIWFSHFLFEDGGLPLPEARVFFTGENSWRSFDAWPPEHRERRVYLRAQGKVSFEPPTEATGADTYVSDPSKPVPFSPRPIPALLSETDDWHTWLVRDQRFVDGRPDVLTYASEPLTEDVTIAGEVMADLRAATSGTDSDWVVKLIDVFPEGAGPTDGGSDLRGFELMIASDIFRGRYRTSIERAAPLTPNQVLRYEFSLGTHAHVFQRGHRLMVQIQSTWFPLYDRNPQRFVPSIMKARPTDFVTATQRVSRSAKEPTSIVLPVLEK
ncbi:MAG: CocE/NonD family hydrolase [Archangium sp.]